MNNKILVELHIPIINKVYEIFIPVGKNIKTITELIIKSLNKLLSCLCQTTYVFDTQYKDSYKYILECIKECRENRLNKYKKKE